MTTIEQQKLSRLTYGLVMFLLGLTAGLLVSGSPVAAGLAYIGSGAAALLTGYIITRNERRRQARMKAYGELPTALALAHEQLQQERGPINSVYCWEHKGPGLGGWCCNHPDCRWAPIEIELPQKRITDKLTD